MDSRLKFLKEGGDRLFTLKIPVNALHQDIADNFYPERATFTVSKSWGTDFASHLTTGRPSLIRQELANNFSSMLRPRGKQWFHVRTDREEIEDRNDKLWLEDKEQVMRRAMYDRTAQFMRTVEEGDNDFASFGQAPMSVDLNQAGNGLMYQSYHPKDMAWTVNAEGVVCEVQRNWAAPARELNRIMKGRVHEKVTKALEKEPWKEFNVRHAIVEAAYYDTGRKWKHPWVSIWYDCDNDFLMEEVNRPDPYYVIPMWRRLSGSPYPFSPCTIVALPDARCIQIQALTLLEAGEKAVDPPMLAKQEVIRGDVGLYAGGITWVDAEHDGEIANALSPVGIDSRGIPFGLEMMDRTREMISDAFFLNKLNLPDTSQAKTAYEISQLVQQYIRNALPLFGPMEDEYNGQICERTFEVLQRGGAFGPPDEIPEGIAGADIRFVFDSPLHEAMEMQKGQAFQDAMAPLDAAIQLDPSSRHILKVKPAIRDVLNGRVPQKWLASEEEVEEATQADAQAQAAVEAVQTAHVAGQAVEQVGKAGVAVKQAEQ